MIKNYYSGTDAASYALKFALQPNKRYRYFKSAGEGGGDCSNFVSQCLLAGGAPMDLKPPHPWWYMGSGGLKDRWSLSWAVAHSLYWCLKLRGAKNLPGLKGIEVENIAQLNIGDIIQYENSKGIIYHSAIITSIGYEGPRISQHSYDAVNISPIKPAAKKLHLMKIIVS